MAPGKPGNRLPLLIVGAFLCGESHADEVFHWVDDNGVMHFSQWAPDDVENIATLAIQKTNPPDYSPQEDPYSIRNQAQRINETWAALEALREKRREKDRDENRQATQYRPPADVDYRYVTPLVYYRPVHRPDNRPGYRPKPSPHIKRAVPATFSPDPMRSAHIGVRSSANRNIPPWIE
jgi:hypothetical protein